MRLYHATPGTRLHAWQAGAAWRAGRLPAAVDRRNTAARAGLMKAARALQERCGQTAFLTVNFVPGMATTYRTASIHGPELLRELNLSPDTVYAVHVGHGVHALADAAQAPTHCPVCGGRLHAQEYVTHQGEIRDGWTCRNRCTHFSYVDDLKAAVYYMAGPSDAQAHHSEAARIRAANRKLREGRHILRGTLKRAPKYRGVPLRILTLRAKWRNYRTASIFKAYRTVSRTARRHVPHQHHTHRHMTPGTALRRARGPDRTV